MKNLFFMCLLLFFVYAKSTNAMENKIILQIENEIITSVDIENEKSYLKALNPNIKNLENDRLDIISKNSLIREKIKKKELLNYTDKIELDEKFLNELIKQRYSRLNFNSKKDFLTYIQKFDLNIKTIEKKISIEALWNQLIYQKFSKNIKIDKENLLNEIKNKYVENEKNYLLSEIVFKVENKNNLKIKYSEILKDIQKENFESAAIIHSISDSSKIGGKLGWIKQNSLNKSINEELNYLKKGDITKPIFTPNGYIILKIDDIEFIKKKYNEEKELNELVKLKTNQQLNQQSIIYFNKIKKNILINEL